MPANTKYLTKTKTQRFAKISAAILGGYLVAASFHLFLATWLTNYKEVFITSVFSLFILWCILMILPFFVKNGWKVWFVYLLLTLTFALFIYLGKSNHPMV